MRTLTFEIEKHVIDAFPYILIGGFLVENLDQAAQQLDGNGIYLESARQSLIRQGLEIQTLVNDPRIGGWRNAFKGMSLKPSTYKSSAEQLVRRLLKNEGISTPLRIVNLYCAVSAEFVAPMGAYDLDRLPEQRISLRLAKPEVDSFNPLGGRKEDMPLSTQVVVYASGAEVICWAFNHRDSKTSCLEPQTKSAVFFGEGICVEHHEPLRNGLTELRGILKTHGAIVGNTHWATATEPHILMDV